MGGPVTALFLYGTQGLAQNFASSLRNYGLPGGTGWADVIYFAISLGGGGFGLIALWWTAIQYIKTGEGMAIRLPPLAIAGLVAGVLTSVYLIVSLLIRELSPGAYALGVFLVGCPAVFALHLLFLHFTASDRSTQNAV